MLIGKPSIFRRLKSLPKNNISIVAGSCKMLYPQWLPRRCSRRIDRLADIVSPRIGAFAGQAPNREKSAFYDREQSTSYQTSPVTTISMNLACKKTSPRRMPALCDAPMDRARRRQIKTPKTFDIDALLKLRPLERPRLSFPLCRSLEHGDSWVGYSLSEFIKQCDRFRQQNTSNFSLITTKK